MGLWAEIKQALNSTIGTDDFQSLDKIINGQKSLLVSDNLYYSFPRLTFNNVTSGKENEVKKNLIRFKWAGSCRITIGSYSMSGVQTYAYLSGALLTISDGGVEINFKKGDVFSIGLTEFINSDRYTVHMDGCKIYADIIDNSAIELL